MQLQAALAPTMPTAHPLAVLLQSDASSKLACAQLSALAMLLPSVPALQSCC
jgi:hypothetical protein